MSSLSPRRRMLYIQAQDISDAPQWAVDLAARKPELTRQEKAECVMRLLTEHAWTCVMVAKLFGVTDSAVRQWLRLNTEEGRTRARDLREARMRRDPYWEARYHRGYREHSNHGKGIRARLWAEQDGRCYLCGDEMGPARMAVIEHDHRCCPAGRSCQVCRRGLACDRCNWIVGYVQDDADLLERIAGNLRTAVDTVTRRLAGDLTAMP